LSSAQLHTGSMTSGVACGRRRVALVG
jgi:hypothetical protein